jgi:hypothetical protein
MSHFVLRGIRKSYGSFEGASQVRWVPRGMEAQANEVSSQT